MSMRKGIFWLHCLTPLHPGSGQAIGVIDRPVIRETATNLPYVQGSSIKGALKRRPAVKQDEDKQSCAFGKGETTGHRGCMTFSDAPLVFFPVRSLNGTFAWVTSALPLARLARFCRLANSLSEQISSIEELYKAADKLEQKEVMLSDAAYEHLELSNKGPVCLEDMLLTRQTAGNPEGYDTLVTKLATELFGEDNYFATDFAKRLVILQEQDFNTLHRRATTVEANIAIDEKGVTPTGSLRYTEFLPAESILFSFLQIEDPLKQNTGETAETMETFLKTFIGTDSIELSAVQFGGDETKGKGIVRPRYTPGTPQHESTEDAADEQEESIVGDTP